MTALKHIQYLDRSGDYAYAPPARDGVINLHEIVSVKELNPYATRSSYEVVRIRFRDGSTMDALGKPADFVDQTRVSIQALAYNALRIDGAHHKQWFLEEILKVVSEPAEYERVRSEWTAGIAP